MLASLPPVYGGSYIDQGESPVAMSERHAPRLGDGSAKDSVDRSGSNSQARNRVRKNNGTLIV